MTGSEALAAGRTGEPLPSIDTLPDIARRLHRLTSELGGEEFAICMVLMRGHRPRLAPVLDSEYPGLSERTRLYAELSDEAMLHHVASHTAPFTWNIGEAPDERAPAPAHFRIDALVAGLGFPVFSEKGQRGAAFFSGVRHHVESDLLWDAHFRCLRWFGIIARLRPASITRRPNISKREMECLRLTANGLTSEEIAERLGLSVHTANQYLASTAQKLDATNRIHAVAKAIRLGLIE